MQSLSTLSRSHTVQILQLDQFLQRYMAVDPVFSLSAAPGWLFGLAYSTYLAWAASVKAATPRDIHGAGNASLEADTTAFVTEIDRGNRGEQGLRIGMKGRAEHPVCPPPFYDTAQIHHRKPIRKITDRGKIMGDEEIGRFAV